MTGSPHPHVVVCIATFRRPEGLRRLLASLNILEFKRSARPRITVVIADNDASSALTADDTASAYPVIYLREARRGLASVRNACLDATPADADFIAFIDDDEWASVDWLDALLALQRETEADVVQGPVVPVYATTAPAWMTQGGYHEVGPFKDGEVLAHGASGNVLIRRQSIMDTAARFHGDFDNAGGEDVDFFHHLLVHGCRIVAAAHATAYEDVPLERMQLAWILRRRFRTGHTLGHVAKRHGGLLSRFVKAGARVGAGVGESLIGLAWSRTLAVRGLTNIAWGLGTFAALTGLPAISDRKP